MVLVISFIATFVLMVSAGLLLFYRDAVMDRLASVVEPQSASSWNRCPEMPDYTCRSPAILNFFERSHEQMKLC